MGLKLNLAIMKHHYEPKELKEEKSDDKYKRLVVESSCILRTPNLNGMQSILGVDNMSQRLILESPNILNCLRSVAPGIT